MNVYSIPHNAYLLQAFQPMIFFYATKDIAKLKM